MKSIPARLLAKEAEVNILKTKIVQLACEWPSEKISSDEFGDWLKKLFEVQLDLLSEEIKFSCKKILTEGCLQ